MSALQLSFNLRTSGNVRTVHLVGNWDGYSGQLPLSKAAAGAWKGTFRFQGSSLKQGQRYWYYYVLDGHHVSHDPSQPSTVESTTGQSLNILDISSSIGRPAATKGERLSRIDTNPRTSRRVSAEIPKGRSLSPSKIVSPRPLKPNAARRLEHAAATVPSNHDDGMQGLSRRFASTSLQSGFDSDSDDSDASDVPSLSSSRSSSSNCSSGGSSPISPSGSFCSCERYGITRTGNRVRLDCGGSRCGFDSYSFHGQDNGPSCGSDDEGAFYRTRLISPASSKPSAAKRHGLVVRSSGARPLRRY